VSGGSGRFIRDSRQKEVARGPGAHEGTGTVPWNARLALRLVPTGIVGTGFYIRMGRLFGAAIQEAEFGIKFSIKTSS